MDTWDNWHNFLDMTARRYELSPRATAAFQARFTQVNPQKEYAALGDLPETQATIFEKFVDYHHNYSNRKFPITLRQRLLLTQGLAKIALSALKQGENCFQIKKKLVLQVITEKTLNQACYLGWLNPVNRNRRTEEVSFTFFYPPFQEYFAALAVENWHFFLTHISENPQQGIYRIFDPLWKQVILFWLGREDISSFQKEEFMQALSEFEDGCKYDFYGFQSYLLASIGISEYKKCTKSDEIVKQIIEYSFGYFDPEEERWEKFDNKTQEAARKTITQTIKETAIKEICAVLQYYEYWYDSWDCEQQFRKVIEVLETIAFGNEQVITLLINFLHPDNKWVTDTLGKIAIGNQKAIDNLINLLSSENPEDIQLEAADALGRIAVGNERAINALINLIHPNNSEDIRLEAIESLGNIAVGNEQVILKLVSFTAPSTELSIRSYSINSLGRIAVGNEQAIKALICTFSSNEEDNIWEMAIVSLGEIGIGNKRAINTLIDLLSIPNESVRQSSAEGLGEIGIGNKRAINVLINLLSYEKDEFVRKSAILSLGKIAEGNEQAIKTLINLLLLEERGVLQEIAVYSLEKIALGNKYAIEALINTSKLEAPYNSSKDSPTKITEQGIKNLDNRYTMAEIIQIISSNNAQFNRWHFTKILQEILLINQQYALVVTALKPYIVDDVDDKNITRCNNCYEIIWHCAQNLSYPEFYHAWHSSSTTPDSEAIKLNLKILPQGLKNAVQNYPKLAEKVEFMCLDGSQFIDLDNPALEIYAALVEKGYSKMAKGEAETLQQLKVYRQLNCPELFLIFYEVPSNFPTQGLNPVFLNQLAKFSRSDRICIITESVESSLQSFSPQLPNLIEVILAWIERTLEG